MPAQPSFAGTRRCLKPLGRAAVVAGVLASAGPVPSASAQAATPPNIVFFMVDDLGWVDHSLGYARDLAQQRGDTDAFFETPNLEALAADGQTFTRAYTPSPVCSPTRASVMLGQSPASHRVTQFVGGPQTPGFTYATSLPTSQTTVAEALRNAGYDTGFVGKWHLGGSSSQLPTNHGFNSNAGGSNAGLPSNWYAGSAGGFTWTTGIGPNTPNSVPFEYLNDRLTREAIDVIERADANDDPFFLALWHYGVHVPFVAPQPLVDKYLSKLDNNTYQKFANINSAERTDIATYAAMMESVDQSLGAVRQELQNRGLADNTVFVFYADNGGLAIDDFGENALPNMNSPLRNGKGTVYEGGIRVPFVVATGSAVSASAIPGSVAPGTTHNTPIIGQDLYNTFLGYAGVNVPTNQPNDGIDLRNLFTTGNAPDRGSDPIVIHYPHTSNQGGTPSSAIVQGDWKLIQNLNTGAIELYDLANNIGETNDAELANLRRTEQMRVELHQYLANRNAPVPSGFTLDTRDAGNPLNVINGSFETAGVSSSQAQGWQPTPGSSISSLMRSASTSSFDGSFVFAISNSGVPNVLEQTLSETYRASHEYTVRFSMRGAAGNAGARLLAGDQVIGTYSGVSNSASFMEFMFIVQAIDDSNPLVGQTLRLQLFNNTSGATVSFDNIRLYAKPLPIPEPGSVALLSLVPALLCRRR